MRNIESRCDARGLKRQESIGVETYDSQARTHIRCLFSFAYCKHCLNKRDIDGLPTQPVCSFTLHIQTGCLVLTVLEVDFRLRHIAKKSADF